MGIRNKTHLPLIVFAACFLFLLSGCRPQAPQIPSQRKGEAPKTDSAALALMELNRQLAQAADRQLVQLVQEQAEPYALYEAGTWMTILDRGDETSAAPAYDEQWTVHMQIYDLSGRMLVDSEASYRIGRHELPEAVDENIGELRRGGKARLMAPWYAAYGLKGTENIPPYENVIIEIELK